MRLAVSVCGVKLHTAKERGASPLLLPSPAETISKPPKQHIQQGPRGALRKEVALRQLLPAQKNMKSA